MHAAVIVIHFVFALFDILKNQSVTRVFKPDRGGTPLLLIYLYAVNCGNVVGIALHVIAGL